MELQDGFEGMCTIVELESKLMTPKESKDFLRQVKVKRIISFFKIWRWRIKIA
jgi:hypothetical protein